MWYDWQPKPSAEIEVLRDLSRLNEYKVVAPDEIPDGIISRDLLRKSHSILLLCSGTQSGRVYFMMNLNRIDYNQVDQMPYCIAFEENQYIPSGLLIQHGDYQSRTTDLPEDFAEYIAASGLYPLEEMPSNNAGLVEDLIIDSQKKAFQLLVDNIRVSFPES
jgi:hypothetical protein